jgi:hypothetical protein
MTVTELQGLTLTESVELLKNIVEIFAVVAAPWVLYVWTRKRKDRAADVLLKLEDSFRRPRVRLGRRSVESDIHYEKLKPALAAAKGNARWSEKVTRDLACIDELLRFYVVLLGIRKAGQVPERALKACYRYWVTHYHKEDRMELKDYVDEFYPTLRAWLEKDKKKLFKTRRFCTPQDFGWEFSSPTVTPATKPSLQDRSG